jgi:pilus assembly protein CpaB
MALRLPRLRINRTWAMLFLAIGLGLLATWLTLQYLKIREARMKADFAERSKGGPGVRVVVPTRDLQRGMVVNQSVVAGREIASDLVYQETITVGMWDKFDGARLVRNVQQGRPLLLSDLQEQTRDFSRFLENGQRAITIETDEVNSIAQLVRPGNLMDLFLILPDPSDPNATTQQIVLLMQRLKVIATGQRVRGSMAEGPPGSPGAAAGARYATFTFEVTPEEAARLALAQSLGKFRAVLRNEPDTEVVKLGRINSRNLLRKVAMAEDSPEERDPNQIEYIIGGRSSGGIGNTINVNVPGMPGVPGAAPGQPAGATGPQMGVPAMVPQQVQQYFPPVPQPPAPAQLPSNQPAPGYGPQNIAR